MREHKKIYSNTLYHDAIIGRVEYIKELTKDKYQVNIDKLNNDMYQLQLLKNDVLLYNIVDTIDCLYRIIDGYYRALYDMKNEG